MTKTRDTAKESGPESHMPDSRPKKVDLHRYQVMTIPMDLQKELASLPIARLTEEEMKPLPPIDQTATGERDPVSPLAITISKSLRFIAAQRVAILIGAVLVIGILWLLGRMSGPPAVASPNSMEAADPSVLLPAAAKAAAAAAEVPTAAATPSTSAVSPATATPSTQRPLNVELSGSQAPKTAVSVPRKSQQRAEPTVASATPIQPAADSSTKRIPRKSVFKPE